MEEKELENLSPIPESPSKYQTYNPGNIVNNLIKDESQPLSLS